MTRQKGYYSLVQYCPDPARAESVNFGVLLFSPEHAFVEVRMSTVIRRLKSTFPNTKIDTQQLKSLGTWVKDRLEVERKRFSGKEDLERFINTRFNDIRLTPPRLIMVEDPIRLIQELFDELVEVHSKLTNVVEIESLPFPEMEVFFKQPNISGHVEFYRKFEVPLSGRTLEVPYVFTNGAISLVKPERISRFEDAEKRLVDGLLLTKDCGEENKKREFFLLAEVKTDKLSDQVGQLCSELGNDRVKFYANSEALMGVLREKLATH